MVRRRFVRFDGDQLILVCWSFALWLSFGGMQYEWARYWWGVRLVWDRDPNAEPYELPWRRERELVFHAYDAFKALDMGGTPL